MSPGDLQQPASAAHGPITSAVADRFRLAALASIVLVVLAYANHWHNPFHFDDSHTIVDNVNIRELSNIPRLLTDARTSSVYPTNGAYRPLTSLTLAIDYAIGGGPWPPAFHASTFVAFLLLLAVIYALCRRVLDAVEPHPHNRWCALFAATLFGVHPVMAQTVNYIIQRAEVWSALGGVTGLVLFAARPDLRKYGFYLAPPVLGVLAKTIGSIFPLFVLLYLLIVERRRVRESWGPTLAAVLAIGAVTAFCARMTLASGTWDTGAPPFAQYLWTQPWIFVRYAGSFLVPIDLSLDPGWKSLASPFESRALAGLAAVALFVGATVWLARRRRHAATAFGLAWFVAALVPVTVFPLAEVTNDHRMFLPFIGLAIASGGLARELAGQTVLRRPAVALGVAAVVLGIAAVGTARRNAVWSSEEGAWAEVVAKNPSNGRARMNYAVALMARGALPEAMSQFERAAQDVPNYNVLEVNTAIAAGALGRSDEAERHFERALALPPFTHVAPYFYGRWLREQGRVAEAVAELERAWAISPSDASCQQELLLALSAHRAYDRLRVVATEILQTAPRSIAAARALQEAAHGTASLAERRAAGAAARSPEAWLDLSLQLFNARDYRGSLDAALEALRDRPDYAEAYNNIAAAHNALGEWAEAIVAADRALGLRPDFPLARNNRAWALAHTTSPH